MLVKIIILIIYLYLLNLEYNKLEDIDRKSLDYFLKYKKNIKSYDDYIEILILNLGFLLLPFKSKDYILNLADGAFYHNYLLKDYYYFYKLCRSKYFWYLFFKNNNINTPKIYSIKKNNIIYNLNNYDSGEYIVKPLNLTMSLGIKKINSVQIENQLKRKKNFIIQQFIKNSTINQTQVFRYISYYDGSTYNLKQYLSNNIKSQEMYGGKIENCKDLSCKNLNKQGKIVLKNMMNKLGNLHKSKLNFVFSIGWDLMIENNSSSFKCYCLEGNIFHSCYGPSNKKNFKLKKSYIDKFKLFCKINNI